MPIELLPVVVYLGGALLAGLVSARAAAGLALLAPVVSGLCSLALLAPGTTASWTVLDYALMPVRADALSLVMIGLFHLSGLIAAVYALQVRDRLQHASLMLYIGGGVGAVLAGDLITLFVFFEIVAMSGALLVLAARTPVSTPAAIRYLVFQVSGGLALLAGIIALGSATGDWRFDHVGLAAPGGWLMMLAFGIKSGFPLLHNWITDGYPNASQTGLAVLAAVTTKVGIYCLARGFAGEGILVGIGTVMALWPLFYTLVEVDLRRVLAYSMMVQLGLMVAGIGVGSALAMDGVVLHVIMDVLFKMTLFMALGVVLMRVGTTRSDRLGGLWRLMPWTTVCVAVAVAANSALPFTGGFISKKVLLTGVEHSDVPMAIWLLLTSLSALGVLYAGLRILWQGFLRPGGPAHGDVREAPWPMTAAMLIPVALLVLSGIFPVVTEMLRPYGSDYWPLKPASAVEQVQMLLFALLVCLLMARAGIGVPAQQPAAWLDAEWIYRYRLPAGARWVRGTLAGTRDATLGFTWKVYRAAADHPRFGSPLGQTWPIGSMALWVAVLLAALLLFGIRQG